MALGSLEFRPVTLRDAPALCEIHRGSDGPYPDPVECPIWVNHSLLNGRLCFVAQEGGLIVGHAEWTLGYEPGQSRRHLYLGMLQVREEYRGQGIGRGLIEHGVSIARSNGCDRLKTVPEPEATDFYLKCGFRKTSDLATYHQAASQDQTVISNWVRQRGVPERTIRTLPLRIGLMQACSRHMWELANRPFVVVGSEWHHPCLVRTDVKAYVQLRYRNTDQAYVLAWGSDGVSLGELCAASRQLGSQRGIGELYFVVRSDSVGAAFGNSELEAMDVVVERVLA